MDFVLQGRFKLVKKIGGGSYGEVWEGYDVVNNTSVAVKIESAGRNCDPQLQHEHDVYQALGRCDGFAVALAYATSGAHNFLVLEHLGFSLEQLFSLCGRRLSLRTVLLLAEQLLTRLEELHTRGFVHRDIKPENFAIGLGEKSAKVFLLDFGLAQRFVDSRQRLLPMRDKCEPTGNARFASLNNHLGCEQSRRDDIEGVAYMLVFFLTGTLPWMKSCTNPKNAADTNDTNDANDANKNIDKLDTTRFDTTRFDTTRFDTTRIDTTRIDTTRIDTTRIDTTRFDTTRFDTTRIDTTRIDTTRFDTTRIDTTRFDTNTNTNLMKMVGKIKMTTSIDAVCQGAPQEFALFLRRARELRYEDRPDYDGYRQMFRELLQKNCPGEDLRFDWELRPDYEPMSCVMAKKNPTPRLGGPAQARQKAKSNPKQMPPTPILAPRLKPNPLMARIHRTNRNFQSPKGGMRPP